MEEWKVQKKWSDRFMPEIKRILGETFICEAPEEEDQLRNTDLIILKMDGLRFACRMRKYEYFLKYPNDITIRNGTAYNNVTELTKIIKGYGDYFFYGFSNSEETEIISYKIINLSELRLWLSRNFFNGTHLWSQMYNADGTKFLAINTTNFDKHIIIKYYTSNTYSEDEFPFELTKAS